MKRAKWYLGLLLVGILLFVGGCVEEPLEVRGATEAKDVALDYLWENDVQNAPSSDIVWQEGNITPPGFIGAVTKEFTSDEWTVKVSYPVVLYIVPPENTVYQVVVSSIKLGWHWKGTVEFDGSVTEISAFRQMSKEESQRIAKEFVKNSPTFVFDGIEDTLRLTETLTARCPYCWLFIFEFDSENVGYGDRTGQALTEFITLHHQTSIMVEQLEITSAMIDGRWDMISQQLLPLWVPPVEQIEPVGYSDISIPIEEFQNQPHIDVVMHGVVGGELTVTLGSNPTTGYQWLEEAKISDETIIRQVSHAFVAPGIDKPPGTPGEEVWTFKALKKGTVTILLEYCRWTGAGLWAVFITATIE